MLAGTQCHFLGGVQQFAGSRLKLAGTADDFTDHLAQGFLHFLHAGQQTVFIARCALHVDGEVAGSNTTGNLCRVVRIAAQRTDDVATDKEQCERNETANANPPGKETRGLFLEKGIDVVDVDAATDDPAPRFEFFYVGKFRV